MCLHNPNCWLWPGHQRVKKPASRPTPTRIMTRTRRSKLVKALQESPYQTSNANHHVPQTITSLDPSEKLSDNMDLVRELLARALLDSTVWNLLLEFLSSELPEPNQPLDGRSVTPSPTVWSPMEEATITEGLRGTDMKSEIILHPIWNRFPDLDKTRNMMACILKDDPAVSKRSRDLRRLALRFASDGSRRELGGNGQPEPYQMPSALGDAFERAVAGEEKAGEMLFNLLNNAVGSKELQNMPPDIFENISAFWRSPDGLEMAQKIMQRQKTSGNA